MITPRRHGSKRRRLLYFLPKTLKRLIYITTLYKKLSMILGMPDPKFDGMFQQYHDLVPTIDTFRLPALFTDQVWGNDSVKELTKEMLIEGSVRAEDIIDITPHWLRYCKAWMVEDTFEVMIQVLSERATRQNEGP